MVPKSCMCDQADEHGKFCSEGEWVYKPIYGRASNSLTQPVHVLEFTQILEPHML